MRRKKTTERRLTPAEIIKFKALLIAKRNEILGNVISMENGALRKDRTDLSNLPTHLGDIGTDNYEVENTLGLMDSERKLLLEIEEALKRIEDGTYGICQGSGKPISKARLKAIPWAKYCVEYANLLEKGLARKDISLGYSGYNYGTDDEQDMDSSSSYQKVDKI
jgi:DnaK suppressor protein